MLKYRVATSLILVPLVIAVLFMLPPLGFALVTMMVCMLGAWEWALLAGLKSTKQRAIVALLCGVGLASMLFLQQYINQFWLWFSLVWWFIALLLVLFYPRSANWWRGSHWLRLLFGVLVLVPFFCGMVFLRNIDYSDDPHTGAWWLLYVMLLVWGADTGAYVFGKLFGKNKLAPKISPGKTWEGLCGGLLTAALIAGLFGYFVPLGVMPIVLLVCSVIAVVASILGDLTESMFKREAGVKDSGKFLPGHGGVLDRIDSLTAAVPVFACFMLLIFGV